MAIRLMSTHLYNRNKSLGCSIKSLNEYPYALPNPLNSLYLVEEQHIKLPI